MEANRYESLTIQFRRFNFDYRFAIRTFRAAVPPKVLVLEYTVRDVCRWEL